MADDRVILRIEVDDQTQGKGTPQGDTGPRYERADTSAFKQSVREEAAKKRAARGAGASSGTAGAAAASGAASSATSAAAAAARSAAGGGGAGSAAAAAAAGAGGAGAGSAAVVAGAAAGAAALVVLAGAALALRKTFDALNDEVERAQRYNANVAGAVAVGEVREQLGDIRRAQQLQDVLTDFQLNRDELSEELRDLRANVLEVVGPLVNGGLELLTSLVERVNDVAELFQDDGFANFIQQALEKAGVDKKLSNEIMKTLRKVNESDDVNGVDFFEDLETFLDPVRVDKGLRALTQRAN